MSKLLSANFMRLKKDKFFWIGMAFMLAAGIFAPIKRYMDMKQTGFGNNIDIGFFGCALMIGIIMAVFCSLFIGTEHSDGTIRNKIIVGQKRSAMYLSNFITCSIVGLLMYAIYFLPYLCIGIPLLGSFASGTKMILLMGLTVFLLAIVFSSIFTLISMLCHNKAIVTVICILLAFAFLLTGIILHAMLDAPKTHSTYTMDENNDLVHEEVPNPKYLDGTKREMIQTLYDINPGGQAIQGELMEAVNIERLPVYSMLIIVITTGLGVIFFKKKDLK